MAANPYESSTLLSEYLLFHYGSAAEILPYKDGPVGALEFPVRAVTEMADLAALPLHARALDLGCAVGRSSFVLSQWCEEVVGIDLSHAFIQAAQVMARERALTYTRLDEGNLGTVLTARLPSPARPERVSFRQGDAMDLPADLGVFDLVLVSNLICRLPQPSRCLERLPDLVRGGGQLIITSPYTWLDPFTPREHWLGGYRRENGRPIVTMEALTAALEPHFQLVKKRDLPLLIREHARKYQWSVAEGSLWLRRDPERKSRLL